MKLLKVILTIPFVFVLGLVELIEVFYWVLTEKTIDKYSDKLCEWYQDL